MTEREALKVIAKLGSVNLATEYERGLRGIIRSMTDCAKDALHENQGCANVPSRQCDGQPDTQIEIAQKIVSDWLGPDGSAWIDHAGSRRAIDLIHRIASAVQAHKPDQGKTS